MNIEELIGKTESEAILIILDNKYSARVVSRDRKHFLITQDCDMKRINLHIKSGIVIRVNIG